MRDLELPQDEDAVLHAVVVAVEEPPGALQPRGTDRRARAQAVVLVEPDGRHARLSRVPERLVGVECGLAGADALLEAPEPPPRLGEEHESLGFLARVGGRMSLGEGTTGLPVVPCVRVVGVGERHRCGHGATVPTGGNGIHRLSGASPLRRSRSDGAFAPSPADGLLTTPDVPADHAPPH
ncbi:MAG: hypothetical protein U0W40_16005 [Acidimicrobiia bacterium]